MLQEARTLFCTPSVSREHRRWKQAAITFAVLWAMSILLIITTSFLIASVQALVLLNIAASLAAAVLTQSLCRRGGTQQSYPYSFGIYRLNVVVRLGSIIFLVFGCATTSAECLHSGVHQHHSNPLFLFAMGVAQLLSQVVFRRYVRLADRVTGHRGMAGAQSEDIIHLLSAAECSDGGSMTIESMFDEFRKPPSASVPSQSPRSSPVPRSTPSDAHRTVHSKPSTIFVYLLCPIVCVIASVLMAAMDSAAPDMIGALFLAAYYAYVGYQNGRDMTDLLMNKCVTDPRRLRRLERYLRNIKSLDGVLLVESTVWWNVNVSESMLLIRLRLVSGADACAVSRAARKQLAELATHVYVECFPAIGADHLGDGDRLSWGAPLISAHGHSHDSHGNCHGDHNHIRELSHSNDHGHSHDRECNDSDHHHDHPHSHNDFSTPSGEITMSVWRHGSELANVRSGLRSGCMGAALPSSAQGLPGAVSSTADTGAASRSLAFPAPPARFRGECEPSTVHERPLSSPLPAGSGSSGHALSNAYGVANSTATVAAAPPPSPGFPHLVSRPYSEGSMTSGNRFRQSILSGTGGTTAHYTSSPAASSPRLPDVPPPVFIPFRDDGGRFGSETRRGAPQGAAHEEV